MKNPKICEILGVEVEQPFVFYGVEYHITSAGAVLDGGLHQAQGNAICAMINNPEIIQKKRFFTAQEIEDAKDLERLFDADTISRNGSEWLTCEDDDGNSALLCCDLFPSIRVGETIKIQDIINGEVK